MAKIRAVLTGDLIGSTRASPAATDRSMEALQLAARGIEGWMGAETRFTRFRGDGWQVLLEDPGFSLQAVVAFIAELAAADTGIGTRIAIGFASVDRIGTADLSDGSGPAFSDSGNALDSMTRGERIALAGPVVARWHEAIFDLTAWTANRWTAAQGEAVALLLRRRNRTQVEIARMLSISPQAVHKRLAGAGWEAVAGAIEAVREHDWGAGDA